MPHMAVMAGLTLGSSLIDRFTHRKTPAEKAMEGNVAQQGQLASQIGQMAQGQHTMAAPAIQKAMQYYTGLTAGNAGLQQSIAPDIANMAENYRGAEQGLMRTMGPGAQRDRAIAEMERQKVGQMGTMGFRARQGAFQNLAGMGMNLDTMAGNNFGGAADVLKGQQSGLQNLQGLQQQRQGWLSGLGANMMDVFMPYLKGMGGGSGGRVGANFMGNLGTTNDFSEY